MAGPAEDDDEDANDSSSLDTSPRKGSSGFLATHSGSGRTRCRGAAYARRVSSARREDGGGSAAVLMQETSLLEALGPRVSCPSGRALARVVAILQLTPPA